MGRAFLVVAVAVMLVLAGCGGGNGTGESAIDDADDDLESAANDSADTDDESDAPDATSDADGDTGESGDDTDDAGDESADGEGHDGTDQPAVDGDLEIHHLDVGQADSTLLVTPEGETILIDTGDWRQDGADVVDYLETREIERIDHLVATHAHADHIGGHAAVIDHLETEGEGIGAAYDSGVAHDTLTYENYLEAIETHDVDLFEVAAGDDLPIADETVSASVLNPPEGESGTDLHYNSVALALEFGDVRYLTTGDAEADAESRLVDEHGETLEADAYQAGHHGSSTSSSEPFLEAVDPDLAVISSASESQYGHPHDEVLERFAERGIETYWTGVHGDVVLTTDGETVEAEATETFSTDAEDLRAEKPDDEDPQGTIAPVGSQTAVDSLPAQSAAGVATGIPAPG